MVSPNLPGAKLPAAGGILAAAALVALGPRRAAADIVVLTNGNEIQGEVVGEDQDRIVVRFPGGTLELERRRVRSIQRQSRAVYLLEEGDKALRRGSPERAVERFLEARREDAGSERARQGLEKAREALARQLVELRRRPEALQVWAEILRADPAHPSAREEIEALRAAEEEAAREEARAREELARGDAETAVWRLERLYQHFPERRATVAPALARGLVAEGKGRASRGEWEKAAAALARAAAIDPARIDEIAGTYTLCQAQTIRPLAERGDFQAVEKLARDGLLVAPGDDTLRYYLALSLEARGRSRQAARIYADILRGRDERPAPDTAVASLRKRTEGIFAREQGSVSAETHPGAYVVPEGSRELRTPHFLLHHRDPATVRAVAREAERAYEEIFRFLRPETHWQNPCEVVIFPDRSAYLEAAGVGAWSGAAHFLKSRRGSLSEHRILTYRDQPRLLQGVLAHEVAHALLTHRLNTPEAIPLWSNEGFAVSMEPGYIHQYYRDLVRDARDRRTLLPLAELLALEAYPGDDAIDLFYAQAFSLVDFLLRRKGPRAFVELLRDLSPAGSSLEAALARRYRFPSILALENAWRGSLGRR